MDRAELPVHRNRTLYSVIVSPSGGKYPNQIVSTKLNGFRAQNQPPPLNTLLIYLSTIA
jgi:hypothetical protein